MNKRLLVGAIFLIGFIFIVILVTDYNLNQWEGINNPNYLSRYADIGYFKIDPKTILTSLDQGNTNVFVPLLEDPNLIDFPTDAAFSWTQADFLKIVSAVGQSIWQDSIEDWNVYFLLFETSCRDEPNSFDYVEFTYFKAGKSFYSTRHLEVNPYYIRWGGLGTYSQPVFSKWKSFNLAEFTITAEDALRISDEHGGKDARLKVNNQCSIYVSFSKDNGKWFVDYVFADFSALVDPYTGSYTIFNASK